MTVNGAERQWDGPVPLLGILTTEGFAPDRCAVLLNGKVVPREELATALANEGDAIEVVSFVGGG